MKTTRPVLGKIVNHGLGLGAPSPDTVRQRALELAQIDGRVDFTDEDWEQAKVELHGGHVEIGSDGDEEIGVSVSERDMVLFDAGHHAENLRDDQAENAVEELIAEGMDEAVHEQMLQASRVALKEDRGQ